MTTISEGLDSTECSVCHELFTDPKILPCAHLLCRNCLVCWVRTNKDKQCPLCRSPIVTTTTHTSKNYDELVDSFPTDLAMEALVESKKLLSGQHVCCVCDNVTAVAMCLHCGVMMCHSCVKVHSKLPVSQSHKVEDLAMLTPEKLAHNRQTSCPAHPDKTSELFCHSHKTPICHLCASSKHRACPEVTDLSETLSTFQQLLLEMEEKLGAVEVNFNTPVRLLQSMLLQADLSRKSSLAGIDAACDDLQRSIESCRQCLKKHVEEEQARVKAITSEKIIQLGQRRGRITAHRVLIERMKLTVPASSVAVMTNMLESRMKELELEVFVPDYDDTLALGSLIVDPDDVEHVEKSLSEMKLIKELWRFHSNHGKNVQLTNSEETAVNDAYDHSILLSNEPITINKLYEVRVDITDGGFSPNCITVGVLMKNPSKINLPRCAVSLQSSVCIQAKGVSVFTKKTENNYGRALATVSVGSRIGVLMDTTYCLHLYVDGVDQGAATTGLKTPCYAMIDMSAFLKKVEHIDYSAYYFFKISQPRCLS